MLKLLIAKTDIETNRKESRSLKKTWAESSINTEKSENLLTENYRHKRKTQNIVKIYEYCKYILL